jgi:hypothetical protein
VDLNLGDNVDGNDFFIKHYALSDGTCQISSCHLLKNNGEPSTKVKLKEEDINSTKYKWAL